MRFPPEIKFKMMVSGFPFKINCLDHSQERSFYSERLVTSVGLFRKAISDEKNIEQIYLACVNDKEHVLFEVGDDKGVICLFDKGEQVVVQFNQSKRNYTLSVDKEQLNDRFDDYYFYVGSEILYRKQNGDK